MKFYEGCIELSDEHLIWKLNNPYLDEEDGKTLYGWLIEDCQTEFKRLYGIEFYMMGRSGRHICVENTPKNRQSYYRMKCTIERLQKAFVSEFNSTKDIFIV